MNRYQLMTIGENHESSFFIAMKGEYIQEKRNEQTAGTKRTKKIGKVSYKVIVHFKENATETMQVEEESFSSKKK